MNTCLGTLRKKRTHEAWELDRETACPPEAPGSDADPEEAALTLERRNEVWAAFRHVRAEHRAALILKYIKGLSYVDIAEVLGVTEEQPRAGPAGAGPPCS